MSFLSLKSYKMMMLSRIGFILDESKFFDIINFIKSKL